MKPLPFCARNPRLLAGSSFCLVLALGCNVGSDDIDDTSTNEGSGGEDPGPHMDQDPEIVPEEPCLDEQVACNGKCLAQGESADGCHYLLGNAGIYTFVVMNDGIYAAVQAGSLPQTHSIVTFDKETLSPGAEIVQTDPTERIDSLAVSDTHVGWLTESVTLGAYALNSAPKGGDALTELYTGKIEGPYPTSNGWLIRATGFDVDDDLYIIPFDGGEPAFVGKGADWLSSSVQQVVEGYFYFDRAGLTNDDTVWRLPLGGGEPELLASAKSIYSFHTDGTHLYYLQGGYSSDPRHFSRVPVTGGTVEDIGEDFDRGGSDLYGYGSWLFFVRAVAAGEEETVYNLVGQPKEGGSEAILATTPDNIETISVDGTGIYFLQSKFGFGNQLVRVDLPE